MSPNPLNVNIKYGNSEKVLKSINTSTNYVSMNTEKTSVAKAKEAVRGGSGMEKMILLSDSEIYDVAIDVLLGKYSNGEERRKKLEEAGYDCDTIQSKVNELLPTYQFALEAIEKKYREDDIDRLSKEKGLNSKEVKDMVKYLKDLAEKKRLEKEKIEQQMKEQEATIEKLSGLVEKVSDTFNKATSVLKNKESLAEIIGNEPGTYYTGHYDIVDVDGKKFVVFKQGSSEFSSSPYPGRYEDGSYATVGLNGCAICCVCTVASGYGLELTPDVLAGDG